MRYMKEDRKYEVGNIIYIWCIQFAYRDEEFNFSSLVISIALVKKWEDHIKWVDLFDKNNW